MFTCTSTVLGNRLGRSEHKNMWNGKGSSKDAKASVPDIRHQTMPLSRYRAPISSTADEVMLKQRFDMIHGRGDTGHHVSIKVDLAISNMLLTILDPRVSTAGIISAEVSVDLFRDYKKEMCKSIITDVESVQGASERAPSLSPWKQVCCCYCYCCCCCCRDGNSPYQYAESAIIRSVEPYKPR